MPLLQGGISSQHNQNLRWLLLIKFDPSQQPLCLINDALLRKLQCQLSQLSVQQHSMHSMRTYEIPLRFSVPIVLPDWVLFPFRFKHLLKLRLPLQIMSVNLINLHFLPWRIPSLIHMPHWLPLRLFLKHSDSPMHCMRFKMHLMLWIFDLLFIMQKYLLLLPIPMLESMPFWILRTHWVPNLHWVRQSLFELHQWNILSELQE